MLEQTRECDLNTLKQILITRGIPYRSKITNKLNGREHINKYELFIENGLFGGVILSFNNEGDLTAVDSWTE